MYPYGVPRALEVPEIKEIVQDFRRAARNAIEAGRAKGQTDRQQMLGLVLDHEKPNERGQDNPARALQLMHYSSGTALRLLGIGR
jgi:hypothetical protein